MLPNQMQEILSGLQPGQQVVSNAGTIVSSKIRSTISEVTLGAGGQERKRK